MINENAMEEEDDWNPDLDFKNSTQKSILDRVIVDFSDKVIQQ